MRSSQEVAFRWQNDRRDCRKWLLPFASFLHFVASDLGFLHIWWGRQDPKTKIWCVVFSYPFTISFFHLKNKRRSEKKSHQNEEIKHFSGWLELNCLFPTFFFLYSLMDFSIFIPRVTCGDSRMWMRFFAHMISVSFFLVGKNSIQKIHLAWVFL